MRRASKKRLKNLIIYILQKYNNTKLTETKLQKLLYFCDFGYYQESGNSITGYQYRKNLFGPTIMDLPFVLKELEEEGLIHILKGSNYFGSPQKTFSIANSEVLAEGEFSEAELLTINRINDAYKELTPREVTNISHADFPYLATEEMGQVVDYELTYYREGPGEDLDIEDVEAKNYFSSPAFAKLMKNVDRKIH